MNDDIERLLELADRFADALRELTCEVGELNERVSRLEKQSNSFTPIITEVDELVLHTKNTEDVSDCGMSHK